MNRSVLLARQAIAVTAFAGTAMLASAAAGPALAASAVTSATSGAAVVRSCSSSALRVTPYPHGGGGAAGHFYLPIDFKNISGHACTLFGYPGVSWVTGPSGKQIGAAATRDPWITARTVRLAPGAIAHATLEMADVTVYSRSTCRPVTAHWLRVYPPNQYAAITIRLTELVCSAKIPASLGSPLLVDAVSAGRGADGQP